MGSSRGYDQKPSDIIMSSERKIVGNYDVTTKVDTGRDHRN